MVKEDLGEGFIPLLPFTPLVVPKEGMMSGRRHKAIRRFNLMKGIGNSLIGMNAYGGILINKFRRQIIDLSGSCVL